MFIQKTKKKQESYFKYRIKVALITMGSIFVGLLWMAYLVPTQEAPKTVEAKDVAVGKYDKFMPDRFVTSLGECESDGWRYDSYSDGKTEVTYDETCKKEPEVEIPVIEQGVEEEPVKEEVFNKCYIENSRWIEYKDGTSDIEHDTSCPDGDYDLVWGDDMNVIDITYSKTLTDSSSSSNGSSSVGRKCIGERHYRGKVLVYCGRWSN
ncbi:hypothetical protein AB7942_30005 [Neobacillus sp. BF23-41]|uniref:hypothetical protein n=1 Tax=Neobacillus sp. BF23-41 TaxID=3240280 RepID=UPI0034E5403F